MTKIKEPEEEKSISFLPARDGIGFKPKTQYCRENLPRPAALGFNNRAR